MVLKHNEKYLLYVIGQASIAPFGIETIILRKNYFSTGSASIAPFGIETNKTSKRDKAQSQASIAPFGIETWRPRQRLLLCQWASIAPFGIETKNFIIRPRCGFELQSHLLVLKHTNSASDQSANSLLQSHLLVLKLIATVENIIPCYASIAPFGIETYLMFYFEIRPARLQSHLLVLKLLMDTRSPYIGIVLQSHLLVLKLNNFIILVAFFIRLQSHLLVLKPIYDHMSAEQKASFNRTFWY